MKVQYGKFLTFYENGKTWSLPIDHDIIISHEDEPYFSWQGCDSCFNATGKRLGSNVYDCKVYPSLEHAKSHVYWDKQLCDECLYEHEYGIGSLEE